MSAATLKPQSNLYRPGEHVKPLDGLRGVAITMVIFHHCLHELGDPTVVGKVLTRIGGSAWLGVDVFFALSGFLITGILLGAKNRPNYMKNFLARRALRIFPLYFVTIASVFVALPLLAGLKLPEAVAGWNQLWYWTYTANYHFVVEPFGTDFLNTEHVWSLCIEEQFYCVWPIVVWALSRRALGITCAVLMTVSLGLRFYAWGIGCNGTALYMLTSLRIDGLLAGSLVAIAFQSSDFATKYGPRARKVLTASLIAILAIGLFQTHLKRTFFMLSVGTTLLAFASAAFIATLLVNKNGRASRILCHKSLTFFGKYSYALYLLHPFVLSWIHTWWSDAMVPTIAGSTILGRAVFTVLAFAFSIAAAILSWVVIERPFLGLKKYFETSGPRKDRPAKSSRPSVVQTGSGETSPTNDGAESQPAVANLS